MMTMVHGHQVAYTDEGKGQALLFVHGFPLNQSCWSKQVAGFMSTHRVITPDLRGFGASEPGIGPASMQGFAEDLFTLCQQLQTGPVVLVGHSMGGYIALAFAKAYPAFLSGLVLVSTRAGGDDEAGALARRATAKKVQEGGFNALLETLAPNMLSVHNTDSGMAQAVREIMGTASSRGVVSALLGMAERPDERGHLKKIRVPTLVVTGADDIVIPPSESTDMAEAIPNAELVVIPHAGHLVAFEQSVAFNRALMLWLEAHGPEPMAWASGSQNIRPRKA